MFDNFELVLSDNAEEKWQNLTGTILDPDRTAARFDAEMHRFYLRYTDNRARDVMFGYLAHLTKSHDTDTRDHADRMETLYRYSNRLPGTQATMNADQIKEVIFASFPETWQRDYIRGGNDLQVATLPDIVQYMANEKVFADNDEQRKRKGGGNNVNPGREPKRQKNGNGNGKGSNKQGGSPCRLHNGTHQWKDCFNNPRNPKYKGPFRGRNDRGGRGGQGNGGRNDRGGRGGNTQNRGGYHQNNNGQGGQNYYNNNNERRNNNNGADGFHNQGPAGAAPPNQDRRVRFADQQPQQQGEHYFNMVGGANGVGGMQNFGWNGQRY